MADCIMMRRGGGQYQGTLARQPARFTAQADNAGQIRLTWSWEEDPNRDSLLIVRRTDRFPQNPQDGTQVYQGTGTEKIDSSLVVGTVYYYRAFARNKDQKYQNAYCQAAATALPFRGLHYLNPGDVVKVLESGVEQEYLVVCHGYPQPDDGATLLLRRHIHSRRAMNSGGQNEYNGGAADSWLTGTFFSSLSEDVQAVVKSCSIPYTGGGSHVQGALERKVFLLSATEVGGGSLADMNQEGRALDLFLQDPEAQKALYNGAAQIWTTRSPKTGGANAFWALQTDGSMGEQVASRAAGIRPAFAVPSHKAGLNAQGVLIAE